MNDFEFKEHQKELKARLYEASGIRADQTQLLIERQFPYEAHPDNVESQKVPQARAASNAKRQTKNSENPDRLKADELLLSLIRVWLNLPVPFLTQGQLFKKLEITSGSRQSSLKKMLIREDLIIEHRIQVGKTHSVVPEPTIKAYEKGGVSPGKFKSKGGYLHQFLAHHFAVWGNTKSYDVNIEFFLSSGKALDVVLRKPDVLIFVEIAISEPLSKEITNVLRDLETELTPTEFWILVVDGKMKRKLEQLIARSSEIVQFRNLIKVKLAGDFIQR